MIRSDLTPWMADAACRGMDPDLFFPTKGRNVTAAKAVCARCPVQVECLDHALVHEQSPMSGVWGGMSPKERRVLRRERGIKSPPKPIMHGTEAGYVAHRRRGEDPCRGCVEAQSAASRARRGAAS